MDKQLKLILGLVLSMPLVAQMPILPGVLGPPLAASGTSVTVNLGGTGYDTTAQDSGNALFIFASEFVTPSAMTAPSFNSCGVAVTSPDSANPDWGCAIFADASASGTLSTSGTSVTGTGFNTTGAWTGNQININGTFYTISTVSSSTALTLTATAGTQSSVPYRVQAIANKLCSTFSSTTPSAGWPALSLSGASCPTPTTSTPYWVAIVETSNSITQPALLTAANCPGTLGTTVFGTNPLGSFSSNASWPSSFQTVGNAYRALFGCYAAFVTLSYTTTAPYTIISFDQVNCGPTESPCTANIIPFGSGHSLIMAAGNSTQGASIGTLTVTDSASDTISANGTCPAPTGLTNPVVCLFSAPRATAGITTVSSTYSIDTAHTTMYILEVAGTKASSSFDKSAYDAALNATPFTSAATATTTQATEFLLGACYNNLLADEYVGGFFTPSGSWSRLYSGQNAEATGSANFSTFGVFGQTVTSTGAYSVTGSFSASGTDNACGLATYE
jgi:hypothetical protein